MNELFIFVCGMAAGASLIIGIYNVVGIRKMFKSGVE